MSEAQQTLSNIRPSDISVSLLAVIPKAIQSQLQQDEYEEIFNFHNSKNTFTLRSVIVFSHLPRGCFRFLLNVSAFQPLKTADENSTVES